MSILDTITTGKTPGPRRVVIYGPGGIGKSTWASQAPNPVFIQTEDGLADINTSKFPFSHTLAEVKEQLRALATGDHAYKTAIIDSLDQLEPLIWEQVATSNGKSHVAEIPYGKGYEQALSDWRKILFVLDKIRDRGIHVILIGHAKIERFENPATEPYDRYNLQLHKKAAAEVTHWADEILFTNYRVHVRKSDQGFKTTQRAVGDGERVVYTQEGPAHIAKSRLSLPPELPLEWAAYEQHFTKED